MKFSMNCLRLEMKAIYITTLSVDSCQQNGNLAKVINNVYVKLIVKLIIIEDNELKFASIDMSSVAAIYTFLLEEKGLMIHPKTSYKQYIKKAKKEICENKPEIQAPL